MCGISGIISFNEQIKTNEEILKRYASFNKYRGPDEYGQKIETSGNFQFLLAHHRLSILDLTPSGQQPMTNNTKDIFIIYNGEVFNFLEIKKQLITEDVTFEGTSDTEVILRAYQTWGIDKTLAYLEGMFALCIVDIKNSEAFIARDSFGKKPLYYSTKDGNLSFSSDIRSFKELDIKLEINIKALSYYFSELATPGDYSIFEGIHKLTPGTYLKINARGTEKRTFKKLSFKTRGETESNVLKKAESLLINAVKTRLVADVPVVTFLSGGIDSGLLTALSALNYGKQISTYTVGYENYPFDERPYAKIVAEKYITNHHEIILNSTDADIIGELITEFGEPFADSSMIPSYHICSAISSQAKVAISGDGGDEIFLGYPTYIQAARMQNLYNKYKFFAPITNLATGISANKRLNYLNGILNKDSHTIGSALYRNMGFSSHEIGKLFKGNPTAQSAMDVIFEDVIEEGKENYNNIFGAVWYGTFKTRLLNDYLVKVDRASMFASVEVRSPFLDDQLQDYVCSLPHELLIPGGQKKFLLKEIAKKYLPDEILNKPKTGFGIPVGEWFRTTWKTKFEETVLQNRQSLVELDYDYIEKLFSEHLNGHKHDDKIWALYVFHYWCAHFFRKYTS